MRPQQNRRVRGRNNNGNNNRRGPNPLSRNYESNGPDVKIRGNAQQIADKYISLARDAQGAGDSVMSENYLQHAEHYLRIILAANDQMSHSHKRDENNEQECEDTSVEESTREDNNNERPSLQEHSSRNGDGRKNQRKGKYTSDTLDENFRADKAEQQEQQTAEEGAEASKSSRRLSRSRRVRVSETLSSKQSTVVSDSAEKVITSAEKIVPLPLLSEKEQKKPRRRRATSSSSVEENT
ncbi:MULTISPECIES: DUF4167 domain-containing protein [unclassified Bartonella]|uniref:DUF4167 domain-containing protein n=1 Tax=unclassified Bartonella TaxID=2645622 RepID=UPI00099A5FB5|nr:MULTISPECIES: DUF4167 domain-containing protein [unclassified Bartonella]AQX22064.1 protein of unknown function (DUF4167) [Bartonella sp. 11B]AQX24658.1 protein of unknown function (DUF4167) [Bartonella sp. 114]AQX25832.1 protein of unknown function (DUF4167) [Bartonella sp. Coyote22sub2]